MNSKQLAKQKFTELLGKDLLQKIEDKNWIQFRCSRFIVENKLTNVDYQFEILFLEKDGVGDTVIYSSIIYNSNTRKWWSENVIDYPEIEYNSFKKMKQHLLDIEDEIIDNGSTTIDLN